MHRPNEFTDQSTWPDGAIERRAYFGADPARLWQFAPEEGQPVLLRTRQTPTIRRESTGDLYSRQPIAARELEILADTGDWRPLLDALASLLKGR